jgi:hypothetical protein
MATDFRDLLVRKRHIDTPIAGGNDVGDGLKGKSRQPERFFHDLVRESSLLGPGRSNDPGDDLLFDDHRLGYGRTYVNSRKIAIHRK